LKLSYRKPKIVGHRSLSKKRRGTDSRKIRKDQLKVGGNFEILKSRFK